jgi:hypothetical protein
MLPDERPRIRRRRAFAAALLAGASGCGGSLPRGGDYDTTTVATTAVPDSATLPFDTVGAGRGVPPNRFEYSPAGKWLAGDTTVWAHLTVHPSARHAGGDTVADVSRAGPQIEARALSRDTSASTVRDIPLRFADCPFELRLHTDPRRRGAPVWSSARAPRAIACPPRQPPHFGQEERVLWPLSTILGDSLPAGTYYFTLTVRLADGRTLDYEHEVAHLTLDTTPATRDLSALRFASGSDVAGPAPRQLRAWTVVTNGGTRSVTFGHGACALQIRLWREAARTAAPAWRSELRQPVRRPGERPTMYGCPGVLIVRTLRPMDTATFELHVPRGEVLADSLPEGRYWVGVELKLLNDSLRPPAWDNRYAFPAGEVVLDRAQDPLPSVRFHGALRVEAATRLVRGATRDADSVRTFVLVTNTAAEPSLVVIVRGNPVTAYAFRSAAERDSLPIPRPVYTIHGAGYHIPHRFMLEAGKKWLFENGVAARDLVTSAGAGRYFFRAWLMGEPSFMVSAGDVDVR